MAIVTKLPKDLSALFQAASEHGYDHLTELKEAIDAFIEAQEEERAEKSERWLESDRALNHDDWLGRLSEIRDTLETVLDGLDQINFENPPEFEG